MNSQSPGFCLAFLAICVASCATETTPQTEILGRPPLFDRFEGSEWSEPVHVGAPISSPNRELRAQLSPDGLSLYLASNRPGGVGAFDIWVSRRACQDCPWQEPVNLGPNINSAGGDGSPALSADGLLLFFSGSRAGGYGGEDIWMSRRTDPNDDLSWGPPINLGPMVNSTGNEGGPTIATALAGEGANLYFSRAGDIYRARVSRDGEALDTAELAVELNDPTATENEPTVRSDGKEIFFWATAQRGGLGNTDIWVARRQSPHEPWSPPQSLGTISTAHTELSPAISHDGRTLFFAAGATRGGLGFQDIWMSTRRESR